MIIGQSYTPDYECAHAVATEYAAIGVDLGDTFDCDHFSITFVRRLRKMFHQVDAPKDWDLIVMRRGDSRPHIGVMRYRRVKHNHGNGASGAVVSNDLGYIKRIYPNVTYWRLNDTSNLLPDRLGRDD
jgi:hypothetical protein